MKSEKARDLLNEAIAEARKNFPMVHINSFKTDYGISVQAVELAEQEFQEKAVEAFKTVTCQTHFKCATCNGSCVFLEEFINILNNK